MKLQKENQYLRGAKHGQRGHVFELPRSNYDRAYYRAGWNVARGSDIFAGMSKTEKRIVRALM